MSIGLGGWLGKLAGGMNALGTCLILLVMLLVNSDIALRFTVNAPIRGVAELVSLSIVGIVFLQLPHTLRQGQITQADLLLGLLRRRRPRAAHLLSMAHCLIGCALFATLAISGWSPARQAYQGGYYVGSPGDFTAPTWPMLMLIVIGAAVMAVQFLVFAASHGRAALAGSEKAQ
jgi:TRAP-type mannitol/chloroaromatic compound transport system permease small subunit